MALSDGKRMHGMWRMGVPVATPIDAESLREGVAAMFDSADVRRAFENDVKDLFCVSLVRGTNSGRGALCIVLQAMRQMSGRDEVVLPAFACPSIGRAVVKAGLKAVLCDVEANGSGLDPQALERAITPRTLAVVVAHLYGYPCDIAAVLEISHAAGAMVIEDCAQAFGARFRGRFAGTLADAGVFSFGMSKAMWTNGGGLACTSYAELASHIDRLARRLPSINRMKEVMSYAKFAALSCVVRSHHLGLLDMVWGGALRGKDDCKDFAQTLLPASNAGAGRSLLRRFAEINRSRRANALYFSEHLSGFDGIALPVHDAESEPVYVRFPVVVANRGRKREIFTNLRARGINASQMYSLDSYEGLKTFAARVSECPQAEYLAERMLNLPTHAYMRPQDLRATVDAFESVLGQKGTVREDHPAPAAVH